VPITKTDSPHRPLFFSYPEWFLNSQEYRLECVYSSSSAHGYSDGDGLSKKLPAFVEMLTRPAKERPWGGFVSNQVLIPHRGVVSTLIMVVFCHS
jgi:hypothetical protein